MKIFINKKLSEIHWSAFVAAGLCFISTFFIYQEYKEEKYLIEKGRISKAIVTKTPTTCYESSRIKNYVDLIIVDISRNTDLIVDYKICNNLNVGDTIQIRYSNDFERISKYNPDVNEASKVDLYFTIFSFLLGIIFLLFGNDKNKLFQTP